jgi:hypothetical protein
MELYRHDIDVPLDGLVRDARRATEGWNWSRGAYGHALSLPAYRQLHPYGRYGYGNFPCVGILSRCPVFGRIFESLECEKVSFRLLRRGARSSYAWHTDSWKGPGVVRFQIPIVSDSTAFLVLTDYDDAEQLRGPRTEPLNAECFDGFAGANAGHFQMHRLEPGRLYYFDTTRVHTLVNPGPGERITLSFDLVANDWLLGRFPEVRAEVGEGTVEPLPRPGALRNGLSIARSRFYPLRNLARRWMTERGAERER